MNREEATQKYGQTTINGINCGTVKGGFMPNACNERLLEQNIALNILIKKYPECLDALKVIDENYDSLNARETTSTPLQKDTDNKPQIIGKLSHHIKLGDRTPSEVFQSYGDIGIVPSEYFGILESEREACFCTSLARIYKYDTKAHPIRNMRSTLNKEGLFRGQFSRRSQDSPSEHVFFILDDQIYADIENNNFFALKQYPDDSKEQIDIKEQKFYSLSHEKQLLYKTLSSISHGVSNFEESEWFAYPGGIPSKYISGIVMDSELTAIDPNLSATLEKFFPQATIINIQDNSIIREPVIVHEQQ